MPTGYVPTGRTITAGNGLSGGGDLSANRTITLGTPGTLTTATNNTVTSTSHTHRVTFPVVGAGDGVFLSNGLIKLANPGTITNSTTNSVSTSSHTHALTLPSTRNFGVGAYALMRRTQNGAAPDGGTVPASDLRYANVPVAGGTANVSTTLPTGTWRNLGPAASSGYATLYVRTA